jgi:hypothetical protein
MYRFLLCFLSCTNHWSNKHTNQLVIYHIHTFFPPFLRASQPDELSTCQILFYLQTHTSTWYSSPSSSRKGSALHAKRFLLSRRVVCANKKEYVAAVLISDAQMVSLFSRSRVTDITNGCARSYFFHCKKRSRFIVGGCVRKKLIARE